MILEPLEDIILETEEALETNNKMKNTKLYLFALAFLSLTFVMAGFASAAFIVGYPAYQGTVNADGSTTGTATPVADIYVEGYLCLTADCTQILNIPVPGLTLHTTLNKVLVAYPVQETPFGYTLYFHKDGYIGWIQNDNAWGDGVSWGSNVYLSKKSTGSANIRNFAVSSGTITATVDSAISKNFNTGIAISEKVSTAITAVVKRNGQQIFSQTQSYNIAYSGSQAVSFTYSGYNQPGNYEAVF